MLSVIKNLVLSGKQAIITNMVSLHDSYTTHIIQHICFLEIKKWQTSYYWQLLPLRIQSKSKLIISTPAWQV